MNTGVGRRLAPPRQSHARCRARNPQANFPPEHVRCTHTHTCKGGTSLQHCAAAGNVLRLRSLPDASALRPRRTLVGMSVYQRRTRRYTSRGTRNADLRRAGGDSHARSRGPSTLRAAERGHSRRRKRLRVRAVSALFRSSDARPPPAPDGLPVRRGTPPARH